MKMKARNKILLLALCMAALIAVSVIGTMAYLTSTKTVTNTFTVGKVEITLDEAKVGTDGKAITGDKAERVMENSYKLMPNGKYDKDPTVTVKAGSEESYVRILVTATFDKELDYSKVPAELDKIFTGYSSKWVRVGEPAISTKTDGEGENAKTVSVITYEYRYDEKDTKSTNATVSATNADKKLDALFTKVEIPSTYTNDDLAAIGGMTIKIVAEAIQADGFADANAAWAAFN